MFRHLLAPTDGSPLSLSALRTAVAFAHGCGARVTFLACSMPAEVFAGDPLVALGAKEYAAAATRLANERLQAGMALAHARGVEADVEHLFVDHPWRGIVEAAERAGCDLIVMASHGRKGVGGVVPGSQTQKVLAHSRTPVLVCRSEGPDRYRNILLPTDGSEASEAAMRLAIDLAAEQGARVTLITCCTPHEAFEAAAPMALQRWQYEQIAAGAARRILEPGEAYAAEKGVPLACDYIFAQHPHSTILNAARRLGCDLIVMASHGRKGAAALLLGSETLKVIAHAPIPVLVCH